MMNYFWLARSSIGSSASNAERGINYLLVTMIGVAVAGLFLAFGVPGILGALDSARTAKAKDVMASDIATQVHTYFVDTGSFPGSGSTNEVMAAMGSTYFPATPCDPVDSTCTPTSASSDFYVYSGVTSSNQVDYDIHDASPHPAKTLRGLQKYGGNFIAPTATCANDCTHLEDDGVFGILGSP